MIKRSIQIISDNWFTRNAKSFVKVCCVFLAIVAVIVWVYAVPKPQNDSDVISLAFDNMSKRQVAMEVFGIPTVYLGALVLGAAISLLLIWTINSRRYITMLRKKNELLFSAENKYKTIFENAAVGIARVDNRTGRFVEVNDFLCNLLGFTSRELKGKSIQSLLINGEKISKAKLSNPILPNEESPFSNVKTYLSKNGEVIWANTITTPVAKNSSGTSDHIIIIEDISKQILYENQLLESQQYVEELINSIEGIVWEAEIGEQFTYTFISSKIQKMLGYTVEEWMGDSNFHQTYIYKDDKDAFKEYIEKELFTKLQHTYEYRIVAKDGEVVWIREIVNIAPNLAKPEKMSGIMMDVTSLKGVEETLKESYDVLNEQNKRLLSFSHIISHNLRSHASNIEGITTLLGNTGCELERTEMIGLLSSAVLNLNDTLYSLNSIINVKSSEDLFKESLNLREYIEGVLVSYETIILSKNAQILNEVPSYVLVKFNKAYLESVLHNLISNALRYCDTERIPKIHFSCRANVDGWILSIADNGVGIDLNKYGNKLFGLNQTFHHNSNARGFGLFITKNLIEAMGDKIDIESSLGNGTTFHIFFN